MSNRFSRIWIGVAAITLVAQGANAQISGNSAYGYTGPGPLQQPDTSDGGTAAPDSVLIEAKWRRTIHVPPRNTRTS